MRRTSRKGFTLMELIISIVLLGILAGLAVPAFQAIIERSRKNAVAQAGNSIARELHALATFDADFDTRSAYLSRINYGAMLDEAGNGDGDDSNEAGLGDIPAVDHVSVTVANPDGVSDNGDEVAVLLVEDGDYEVLVRLGEPGALIAVESDDVVADATDGTIDTDVTGW